MGIRSAAIFVLAWWGGSGAPQATPGRCVGPPVRMLTPDPLDQFGPDGSSHTVRRFVAGDRQLRVYRDIIGATSLVTGKRLARARLPLEVERVHAVANPARGFLIASPREGGALLALDAVGANPIVRWRTPLAPDEDLFTGAAGADRGALVVGRFNPQATWQWLHFDLAAVETATGRFRWRVPLELGGTDHGIVHVDEARQIMAVLVDDARVYLIAPAPDPDQTALVPNSTHWLTAYDASTGTQRWKYDTGFWGGLWGTPGHTPEVALDGGQLVVEISKGRAGPEGLAVLDPVTGTQLRRFELPSYPGHTVVMSGIAYAGSDDGAAVVAVDLANGRERWRWEGGARQLTIARDMVVFITDGRILMALDRETGRPLWRWGIGLDGDPYGRDSVSDGGHTAFTNHLITGCVPARIEHVTVRGKVTVDGRAKAGVTVDGGGLSVKTDARGRYALRFDLAGGTVIVGVDDAEVATGKFNRWDGARNNPVFIKLDGRGSYRADIPVETSVDYDG